MSNFFEKSDLSRSDAENIISDTLQKCDDGELYLENSKSESILLDDNKIKNSSYSSDLGFGFRAIADEVVAYSHSNEISKNSLKQSSDNLKSTLNLILSEKLSPDLCAKKCEKTIPCPIFKGTLIFLLS